MTLAVVALALALALAATPTPVHSGAVTDKYVPFCPSYADPPPAGWQRWSSPSTWPGGVIPGVGANMGVNVDINCSVGVILDLNITVRRLNVLGSLRVVDPGPFQVFASFLVNQGRISIGSAAAPYAGKVVFNITDDAEEWFVPRDPLDPTKNATNPRSFGRRAVITLGGSWDVNGLYGNQAGWTTLAQTARAGDTSIVVKGRVDAWPVGGEVALASTDFDYTQAERRRITSVTSSGSTTTLGLDQPLAWMHWGEPLATGVPGVSMDQAGEVMLLTRSIVIQGHPTTDPLFGAHFIIVQTPAVQSIIGLELVNMGQQGSLARYPMHFHLCQDVSGSVVKGCAVHDSNQRCYVVHGSWNARLEGNGAFNTKGHCYMVEDGIEFGNQFVGNLGFYQEPPRRVIDTTGEAFPPIISDNAPSTFWISNANNSFVNNVAAGCFDSGWWFELEGKVGGPSQLFPGAARVYPKHIAIATFAGNSAHSNGRAGLRTYPSGYRPKINGGYSLDQATSGPNAPPANITISGFRAYKNDFIGMFIHETDSVVLTNCMVADNGLVGVELNRAQAIIILDSIILGETDNVGNPVGCGVSQSGCRPTLTPSSPNAFQLASPPARCNLPRTSDPAQVRSYNPELLPNGDLFGILVDADDYPSHGRQGAPNVFYNITFGKFYSFCRNAAAGFTANGAESALWSAATTSRQIKVVDGSAPVWMVRPTQGHLGFEPSGGDAGGMSYSYVLRDEDGSLTGGKGGYVVTANSGVAILPPNSQCTNKTSWNAYSCPGACYRTIYIQGGDYSLTRVSDGAVFTTRGSDFVNLPANSAYRVVFNGTLPASVSVFYMDNDVGCRDPIVLQFVAPAAGGFWDVGPGINLFPQPCLGVTVAFPQVTLTRFTCDASGSPLLQVTMGARYQQRVRVVLKAGSAPACGTLQCGVFPSQSTWSVNDTGSRPSDFLSTVMRPRNWRSARGMLGFGGVGENSTIQYPGPGMLTDYFRQNFTVSQAGCIRLLQFGYIADDAMVVYLNGAEIFRTNLPSTPITPATPALTDVPARSGWNQFNVTTDMVMLRSGLNNIAVELHTFSAQSMSARFDMWMSAIGDPRCQDAQFYQPRASSLLAGLTSAL